MTSKASLDEEKIRKSTEKIRDYQLEENIITLRAAVKSGDTQQVLMALPMLLALTVCPAMLGTQEAIRQSQSKSKREEHRARRCNLIASCVKQSIRSRDINGKLIILKDSKLYITSESSLDDPNALVGHPFSGYFLPYPDSQYEGLVSTICEEPPILNWIYVDKDTYEVKYGLRVDAQPHLTGPFDCTSQDRRMTLEGWEGFVAVEEYPGTWALYFDREDNGLQGKVPHGTRVLEIELTRREKKEPRPKPEDQPQTLDEMMKQHKERTRREEQEKMDFAASLAAASAGVKRTGNSPEGARAVQGDIGSAAEAMENLYIDEEKDTIQSTVDGSTIETGPSLATKSYAASSVTSAGYADDEREEHLAAVAGSMDGSTYKKPYVEDIGT